MYQRLLLVQEWENIHHYKLQTLTILISLFHESDLHPMGHLLHIQILSLWPSFQIYLRVEHDLDCNIIQLVLLRIHVQHNSCIQNLIDNILVTAVISPVLREHDLDCNILLTYTLVLRKTLTNQSEKRCYSNVLYIRF